jgi:hypothetical protein
MNQKIKLGFSIFELVIVMAITALLIAAISQGSLIVTKSKVLAAQSITKSSPIPSITNLLVWYETTMEGSFVAAEAAQGPINTWFNLNPLSNGNNTSGNANNAVAGTPPVYTANTINSLPALVFNGTTGNNYLTFDGTALANSDYTVIVVEQRTSNRAQNYFISGNDASLTNQVLTLGYKSNGKMAFSQLANNYDINVNNYDKPITRINVFRFSSAVGKDCFINGANQTLLESGSPVPTQALISYVNAQIGRHLTGNNFIGNIGEVIIFTKYINDDERKDIEKYLGKKWGVAIHLPKLLVL